MKNKMKYITAAAGIMILAGCASGCASKTKTITIQAKDYVKVNLSGIDKYGTIDFEVDDKKVEKKAKELAKKSEIDAYRFRKAMDSIRNSSISTDDDADELSNGDKVKVEVSVEKKDIKLYGVKVESKEFTYTVKGLEKGKEVDPFEDLIVTFNGSDGHGYVSVDSSEVDENITDAGYFTEDSGYTLSNGDTITVKYECWDESALAEKKIVVVEKEKEYTVEGLISYPTSITSSQMSNINTEILNEVKSTLDGWSSYYWSYALGDQLKDSTVEYQASVTPNFYKGYYGFTPDDPSTNNYFAVYKVDVTLTAKEDSYRDDGIKQGEQVQGTFYFIAKTGTVSVDETGNVTIDKDSYWGDDGYIVNSDYTNDETKILDEIKDLSYYSDMTFVEVQ